MGGKNHQPCKNYLVNSTTLSRYLSLARAELELSNVSLEDILLSELQGEARDVTTISEHLQASIDALDVSMRTLHDLRNQMLADHYEELPPFQTLDLASLGRTLANMGLVSLPSWNRAVDIRRREGFEGLLDYFQEHLERIRDLTNTLIGQIAVAVQSLELSALLEENRHGNFKADFARLYTSYLHLESDFLASSILSTEIWYSFTERGSLSHEPALCGTV